MGETYVPPELRAEKISFEEALDRYGMLTHCNKGTSMLPLLKEGGNLFTVEKKGARRCRKYEVVLYRRPTDRYILHRVVKVLPDGYVILGDNCVVKEYDIGDGDILGVMTSFVRKGKEHSVRELPYRVYSILRVFFFPVRAAAASCKKAVKRILGK